MAAILSRPQCVNIYHFYTSDVFYTDVYYFTFVVPKMYQWQVRNDFNKDVYIYIYLMFQKCNSLSYNNRVDLNQAYVSCSYYESDVNWCGEFQVECNLLLN